MNNFNAEVKQKWGDTAVFKEYENKTAGYSNGTFKQVSDGLNAVFAKFAECQKSGYSADSANAQMLVSELQGFITENFYTCTREILAGLGQMYTCDKRFKNNINSHGEGTAEFVSKAIEIYCK